MSEPNPVMIPLLNPNEPEAQVAAVLVKEGQAVMKGDILCTLETTKSAADMVAETEGYVAGLRLNVGDTARAGEILCYLSTNPDWKPTSPTTPVPATQPAGTAGSVPAGLRISQKALALAQEQGFDLNLLPLETFITESMVNTGIENKAQGTTLPALIFPSYSTTALSSTAAVGIKSLIDLLSLADTIVGSSMIVSTQGAA
jgi:pyruvate/2-oxoglutarate dehydrogenase complex dihydrolipoamide acyltransferase (E2) component